MEFVLTPKKRPGPSLHHRRPPPLRAHPHVLVRPSSIPGRQASLILIVPALRHPPARATPAPWPRLGVHGENSPVLRSPVVSVPPRAVDPRRSTPTRVRRNRLPGRSRSASHSTEPRVPQGNNTCNATSPIPSPIHGVHPLRLKVPRGIPRPVSKHFSPRPRFTR
jgi:hypothetical protein